MKPMTAHFSGVREFDPQLESDRKATVYARDVEEARLLLDDALDYVYLLRGEYTGSDSFPMIEAIENLAGATLEFLEGRAREDY